MTALDADGDEVVFHEMGTPGYEVAEEIARRALAELEEQHETRRKAMQARARKHGYTVKKAYAIDTEVATKHRTHRFTDGDGEAISIPNTWSKHGGVGSEYVDHPTLDQIEAYLDSLESIGTL